MKPVPPRRVTRTPGGLGCRGQPVGRARVRGPAATRSSRPRALGLFCDVDIAGKSPLARHPVDAVEKSLEAREVRLTFPSHQLLPMSGPSIVPPAGQQCSVVGCVRHFDQIETGLAKETLVFARRYEEIEADRAASG